MRRLRGVRATLVGAAAALALTLSGCGIEGGLYDMTLPGGADVGDDPITITADFSDVVDLVPQSSVKVENIDVGRVQRIALNPDGRSAKVTLVVRRDVDLPADTAARLQQTSLLGEKFVALVRPAEATSAGPALGDGAHIGLADTSQVAEIEQVLGAASMILNGGGIGKFQEVSQELQKISDGRPEEIRAFLRDMNTFVTSLDGRKKAITGALDALNSLSQTIEADEDKINKALDGLSPGMEVLVEQRTQLVDMMSTLDELGVVTKRTLDASKEDMIEDLKLLEPILRELAESGDALPTSLEMLLTFPFPDAVLQTIRGDYLNVFVTANFSTPADCDRMGCPWPQITTDGNTQGLAQGLRRFDGLPEEEATDEPTPDATDGPTDGPTVGPSDEPTDGPTEEPTPSDDPTEEPTDGPTVGPGDDPTGGPDATDPTGGETDGPAGDGVSPAPMLLPPTDSPLPGIVQPYVQVPRYLFADGVGRVTSPRRVTTKEN
jgi:phospholipid/cholesterol/gamma-HCH transport system substrate-binding protein